MSRTGRELTLLGIYGAPGAAPRKSRSRLKASATAATATTLRPTPPADPPSDPLKPRGPSRASSLGSVVRIPTEQDGQRDETVAEVDASRHDASEAREKDIIARQANAADCYSATTESKDASPVINRQASWTDGLQRSPRAVCARADSPKGRTEPAKRLPTTPPKCVMSLYGDGFIELIPRPGAQDTLTVPFSIRIRIFKAADESLDHGKVESDASRHVSPELNDEGEFVRWSCCGGTDKSVFGCPVASNEQNENLTVEEMLALRPPKLLACKVSTSKSDPTDTLRFVIFDRGYPAGLTPRDVGALNAGCRVWWQGYECWATNYDIPHGSWVDFKVSFDGQHLQIWVDDELVDTAVVRHTSRVAHRQCRSNCTLGCPCSGSQLSNSSSGTGSICVGGYAKYSKRVNEWRAHAGFVGLVAEAKICASNLGERCSRSRGQNVEGVLTHVVATDVSEVKNWSTATGHTIAIRRNVFWRKEFPSFPDLSIQRSIRLIGNFYHGAHHDISSAAHSSLDTLLVSAVQVGDVRIRIEFSREFVSKFGSEHGCRTQAEYDVKCNEFIHKLEALSPLLVVDVNPNGSKPCVGSFEIYLELARSPGNSAIINLHSMVATSCFPGVKDIKSKIGEIILHEARRSPGEGVIQQAFRYFLSLAEQGRDSRERAFMESVMNRKAVITEKRIVGVFQRIGFHFSHLELQDLIRMFKTMQEEYHRHQHRMDDLPTVSLISPNAGGLYRLPLIHRVSVNIIAPSDRSATRSKWDFTAILLNYDLQLLDFIQSGCSDSTYGNASYAQSRYLHGGFVNRLSIHLSDVASHVYCILFSLRKHGSSDHQSAPHGSLTNLEHTVGGLEAEFHDRHLSKPIVVQLENGETLQQLALFETQAPNCNWLSLAALYRSRKSKLWRFQALGGFTQAASIHTGLEQMNAILVDRHIVQVYEVVVAYENRGESPEFADFANRFSKNIRFGRNGKIQMVPLSRSENTRRGATMAIAGVDALNLRQPKLSVTLRIQGIAEEISVYRHDENATSLPTVQSVCRSILRTLAENGIKESLQQNPFVAGAKKLKRPVTIRVTTEDTNTPVSNAYIFIEKSLDNQKAISNLASKIVPTLTMGSRLVSIRRRLQKKKYSEEVKLAAQTFTENVISVGTRYALVSLRDSKLVPVVRSRAVLRRAMRQRYEHIRQKILSAMSDSERSRIYSRNGPTRFQQLFRPQLNFSPSEKELVNEVVEMELEAFRRELGLLENANPGNSAQDHIEAIWQNHVNGDQPISSKKDDKQRQQEWQANDAHESPEAEEDSEQKLRKPKRSYLTDADGSVTCHLAPGSYSLYVFHNDYFEWTSLAVIFPTVNASGLFGGSFSTLASQEIVVPLEMFKWPYGIQVVDFYHQHIPKQIEGVPIAIIDKVTSEETILTTRSDGSVAWDVRKGIYAVRVPTEGTSIVYSGSKNVVVDGGRYHPPRTIFIPILLGKVQVELTVCDALRNPVCKTTIANIQLITDTDSRPLASIKRDGDLVHSGETRGLTVAHSLSMDSTAKVQLRPGIFTLKVSADGFFPHSSPLNVSWETVGSGPCRVLAVLCPVLDTPSTHRVVFSYVHGTGIFDAMIEIVEEQAPKRICWQRGLENVYEDAEFHGTSAVGDCEHQSFTITCRPGRSYSLRVGVHAHTRSQLRRLQPRAQVYDQSGLVVDIVLQPGVNWNGDFYWSPCAWNQYGEIITGYGTNEASMG